MIAKKPIKKVVSTSFEMRLPLAMLEEGKKSSIIEFRGSPERREVA